MRAGAISAGLFGFGRGESTTAKDVVAGQKKPVASTASLAAEKFASAQIRGLVRQVFLSGVSPIKQVVFTSMQPEIDVQQVCRRVGQALAAETAKDVVIVTRAQSGLQPETQPFHAMGRGSRQLEEKLWSWEIASDDEDSGAGGLRSCMAQIRHEFEYSLIAAHPELWTTRHFWDRFPMELFWCYRHCGRDGPQLSDFGMR